MIERRSSPRVEVTYPVLYSTDIYSRPQVGSTLDLGLGGTRIETLYGLTLGDRLTISIAADPHIIRLRGQVVYTQPSHGGKLEAGVRFEDMPKGDGLYLHEYVNYLVERKDRTSSSQLAPKGKERKKAGGRRKRLFVRKLDSTVTSEDLKELFSKYGEVRRVNVVERRGFGFVVMSTPSEAQRAKEALDYSEFKGRIIRVDEARPRRPRDFQFR
jgi:hypothetical protein